MLSPLILSAACVAAALFFLTPLCKAQWEQTNGPMGTEIRRIMLSNDTLYVATSSARLWRSLDHGSTFHELITNYPSWNAQNTAVIDGPHMFVGKYDSGLLHSSDGGQTWGMSDTALANADMRSINISGGRVFARTSNLIKYSTDWGASWLPFPKGPFSDRQVLTIRMFGDTIFISAAASLLFSADDGLTWSMAGIFREGILTPVDFFDIKRAGPNLIAAAAPALCVSTDHGLTWNLHDSIPADKISALKGVVLAYHDGMISRSDDFGTTWKSTTASPVFTGVPVSDGNNVYLASIRQGVHRSTDVGVSWTTSAEGFIDTRVLRLLSTNRGILASTARHGVFRSTDEGATWNQILLNLDSTGRCQAITTMGDRIIVGTEGGVFLSTDDGASWRNDFEWGNPLKETYSFLVDNNKLYRGGNSAFQVSLDSGVTWQRLDTMQLVGFVNSIVKIGETFLAGAERGVFYSTNEGATWTRSNLQISVRDLIHFNNRLFAATIGGVWVSTDNGLTWTSNPSTDSIRMITFVANGANLFVGTQNRGVLFSSDSSRTWQSVTGVWPDGVTTSVVHDVVTHAGYLYAGTYQSGIVRHNLYNAVSSISEDISTAGGSPLPTAHPNPVAATTRVEFSIEKSGHVTINIVDLTGRIVNTLQSEHMEVGPHAVEWDASSVDYGLYYVQMLQSDLVRTIPLVVVH